MNKAFYVTIFLLTQVMCLLLYLNQDYPTYIVNVLFGSRLPFVKKVVSDFFAICCIHIYITHKELL